MADSFFTGNYALLRTGSQNFSTKISATPTLYGLVAAQAAAYAALNDAYADAYDATVDPDTRTKGKIALRNQTAIPLKLMASDLGKIVEGTPTVNDDQKISLGLNVRATPSPVAPPGTPSNFKATFVGNGDLELTWKCENPRNANGTLYQVWRQVDGEAEEKYIGGAGQRKYTDTTIPPGATVITYQIQAVRTTAVGNWATFVVKLGKTAGGTATAFVTEAPAKKAA